MLPDLLWAGKGGKYALGEAGAHDNSKHKYLGKVWVQVVLAAKLDVQWHECG